MAVNAWLGVRKDPIGVRFDEPYELGAGTVVNVRCDLGGCAGSGYSLDLLVRYVGDNRRQLAIFGFCLERVTDGCDAYILVEGASGLLGPADPVSMCLDLVEIKVVAQPNLCVDEPFEFVRCVSRQPVALVITAPSANRAIAPSRSVRRSASIKACRSTDASCSAPVATPMPFVARTATVSQTAHVFMTPTLG